MANSIVAQEQMQQFDVDIWSMLLHNEEGYGKKRLTELIHKFIALHEKYIIAFDPKHPEADYFRELLDREMRDIWGEEADPFDVRFPYAKQIFYDKPMKHKKKR